MEAIASAPGKLVLMGEYAVLEGAPALVLAVDRRATARMTTCDDGVCHVTAPDLGIVDARMLIDADGRLQWQCDQSDATKLNLVDHLWRDLSREGLAPTATDGFHLYLDTSGFFHGNGAARAKLGLGSSAALTVALASAWVSFAGHGEATADRMQWLQRVLGMHSDWQNGRGSGADVAASVWGGLIAYRRNGSSTAPSITALTWPLTGVHCLFVWSGHAVSTANALKHLDQWRLANTQAYGMHMRDLGALSEWAIQALQQGRATDFLELVSAYAAALDRLGTASGLEIFSPAQRRVADLALHIGVSYKTCGAGGDFGVVFTEGVDRLARIQQMISDEGMHSIPLALDRQGFTCIMDMN